MQKLIIGTKFLALISFAGFLFSGCEGGSFGGGGSSTVAATVNGREIALEEVERLIKQQAKGEEAKLSPLELAQARLQVLESLIQQEVMFQKAEAEKTVPTDDEVNQKFNELKTASGKSAEQFEKELKDADESEDRLRKNLRRSMAIEALVKKITGKVEAPKESEIEGFFTGNKDQFVKKRGATLAAIVVDPSDSGQGDTTKNAEEANARINEIRTTLTADNFATIAREKSEDPSALRGGELGTFSEEDLRKNFGDQYANGFMNKAFAVGGITGAPFFGKFYFFKLLERTEKDEVLTLESPKVRESIINQLTEGRKQLVQNSFAVLAMNEARIVNHLAKRVVDNPNELSGARPAAEANSNANSNSNSNAKAATANANSNVATNAKAETANAAAENSAANSNANVNK